MFNRTEKRKITLPNSFRKWWNIWWMASLMHFYGFQNEFLNKCFTVIQITKCYLSVQILQQLLCMFYYFLVAYCWAFWSTWIDSRFYFQGVLFWYCIILSVPGQLYCGLFVVNLVAAFLLCDHFIFLFVVFIGFIL